MLQKDMQLKPCSHSHANNKLKGTVHPNHRVGANGARPSVRRSRWLLTQTMRTGHVYRQYFGSYQLSVQHHCVIH